MKVAFQFRDLFTKAEIELHRVRHDEDANDPEGHWHVARPHSRRVLHTPRMHRDQELVLKLLEPLPAFNNFLTRFGCALGTDDERVHVLRGHKHLSVAEFQSHWHPAGGGRHRFPSGLGCRFAGVS